MLINRQAKILKLFTGIHKSTLLIPDTCFGGTKSADFYFREAMIRKNGKEEHRKLFGGKEQLESLAIYQDIDLYRFCDPRYETPTSFPEWCEKNDVYDQLKDVVPDCGQDIQIGQKCKVVNSYGILVGPYKIIGFVTADKFGHCVLLDWDCWWHSVSISDLIIPKQRKNNKQGL